MDRTLQRVRRAAMQDPSVSALLSQVERQTAQLIDAVVGLEGLTVDQWRVLEILADGEGHAMFELAGTIVVPRPTLTKIVDRLVDAALVYRLIDDRDRRRVLTLLSDKGLRIHAALSPKVAAVEADLVARIGADGSVLIELLGQLAHSGTRGSARS